MYKRGTIILYEDTSSIPGQLIRIGSGSPYTHCALALGNGTAIQCEFPHGGVVALPEGSGDRIVTLIYAGDVELYILNLEARKGDTYDVFGLLANPLWNLFGFRLGLRTGKWNCATFMAQALPGDVLARIKKPIETFVPKDFEILFPKA